MSYGIQTTLNLAETPLFAEVCEEAEGQEAQSSSQNHASGSLKSGSKQYCFTPQPQAPKAKEAREYVLQLGTSPGKHMQQAEKPSFMNMARASAYRPSQTPKGDVKESFVRPNSTSGESKSSHTASKSGEHAAHVRSAVANTPQGITLKSPSANIAKETIRAKGQETRGERKENGKEATISLATRKWSSEETREWWDARYDQKERQGDQQKQDQQEEKQQEENALRVTKKGRSASRNTPNPHMATENNAAKPRKPDLIPPKMGVFALYYVLTKMGIQSDGASNFSYKKEIEQVDGQVTETHKKRLAELKEAINKESESTRWGVASKIFSWMASFIGMISGAVLIATGVGVVAGSMMIIGGMIQITNQILEMSGGWQKIAELLPGEDTEKKGAVVAWMQIGVAVLSLILAGVGAIWGGYANFGEAASTATALMSSIATMGHGITTIGQGINVFMFKDKLGDIKQFELRLAQLKHMRQDLMEKVEWGIDRLEKLFEDLAKALEFDEELFYADQMLYRR